MGLNVTGFERSLTFPAINVSGSTLTAYKPVIVDTVAKVVDSTKDAKYTLMPTLATAQAAADAPDFLGILQNAPVSANLIDDSAAPYTYQQVGADGASAFGDVLVQGRGKITLDGTVAAGAVLMLDRSASYDVVTYAAPAAGDLVIGVCLEGGDDGDTVEFIMTHVLLTAWV